MFLNERGEMVFNTFRWRYENRLEARGHLVAHLQRRLRRLKWEISCLQQNMRRARKNAFLAGYKMGEIDGLRRKKTFPHGYRPSEVDTLVRSEILHECMFEIGERRKEVNSG